MSIFEREHLQSIMRAQNPWQQIGEVPLSLAPQVERPLARHLWQRLLENKLRRYQVILGPRRVGKTTVLHQTVARLLANGVDSSRIWWLRLDHPALLREQLGELVRFAVTSSAATPERPAFVMLDELVYAEHWDIWLKTFYDEQWPVQIAATSSAAASLHQGQLESGVGRWEEQYLGPYSFTEYLELAGRPRAAELQPTTGETLAETLMMLAAGHRLAVESSNERRRFMLVGGFPELLMYTAARPTGPGVDYDPDDAELLLMSQQVLRNDAVERTLYKDIHQSFGVDNRMALERLLYVLADQVAGLLSPTNISRDLGIAVPTIERYLSYLEHAFLVFTLPNFSGRETATQRRGRKLYFIDGAVRNAALQRGIGPLHDPNEMGLLIENLVATSLRTLAAHRGVRLHHWRDGDNEVDLIYNDPGGPLAFEIASSPSHSRKGLAAFTDRHPQFKGSTYLVAPNAPVMPAQTSEHGIGTLPLEALLSAIDAQAHRAMMNRLGVRR